MSVLQALLVTLSRPELPTFWWSALPGPRVIEVTLEVL